MKQFMHILNFEFSGYLKNKVFVGITLVMVLAVTGVLFFPRISTLWSKPADQPPTDQPSETDRATVYLVDVSGQDPQSTLVYFQNFWMHKDIQLSQLSIEELTEQVNQDSISAAIVLHTPMQYTYIVKDVSMYENPRAEINQLLLEKHRMDQMAQLGLTQEQVTGILYAPVEGELIQTGKDQMLNFFYTYVLIFGLYMAIMLYGQLVATGVATEKSSRAMELLITSAKPTNLMFGKVLGSGLAGLLQLVVILGASFISFNFTKADWVGNPIVNSIFNMPVSILLYTILFFLLGFFLYAFLYGAVGSLASKVEDINTSVMPITFTFVAAFMIVMMSMSSGNVETPLMVVASFVPFTSPMAMFVRIAMGNPTSIEIIISVVILLVSTIGVGYISAKIYRIGVLMYGKPPKLSTILKSLKNA
jgi:ABC-2 type transport system permease protein